MAKAAKRAPERAAKGAECQATMQRAWEAARRQGGCSGGRCVCRDSRDKGNNRIERGMSFLTLSSEYAALYVSIELNIAEAS